MVYVVVTDWSLVSYLFVRISSWRGGGKEGRCDDLRTDQVTAWRQNNLPGYFPSVSSPACCYVAPGNLETLYFTEQVAGYNSINSYHQLKFTLKLMLIFDI